MKLFFSAFFMLIVASVYGQQTEKANNLVDYITSADGGNYAVRETVELIMALSGKHNETIQQRMDFSDDYKRYWQMRNLIEPAFYTTDENIIIQQTPQ